MIHIRSFGDDNISKNMYLQELHNRNETLYHRVLVDNIEEVAPLVYTPTVGHVCQQFGAQLSRSRGMYFSSDDRGEPRVRLERTVPLLVGGEDVAALLRLTAWRFHLLRI